MLFRLLAKLREWWFFVSEAERLSQLDDRLLTDMGIERSQIGRMVRGEPSTSEALPKLRPQAARSRRDFNPRSAALAYAPRRGRLADCTD